MSTWRKVVCCLISAVAAFGAWAYDDGFVACDDESVTFKALGTWRVYVFTNVSATANLTVLRALTLEEWLVVGGGGAGGYYIGGGGGGGGVLHLAPRELIGAGTQFSATVGAGGLARDSNPGLQGGHSTLTFGGESFVAFGGNGGSSWQGTHDQQKHEDGQVASGGGLCYFSDVNEEGKTWNPKQGNSGGPKDAASGGYAGGGGGGARTASTNVNGGEGAVFELTGEALTYGSGGGGGTYNSSPSGVGGPGAGNGGDGKNRIVAVAGTDGLGGGGGGGGGDSIPRAANGGSGTVILVFTVGDHTADSKRLQMGPVDDWILTGDIVTPEPVVTSQTGEVLTKDLDYTLDYTDNDKAGVGVVTAVGKPNTDFEGFSVSTRFSVLAVGVQNEFIATTDAAADIRMFGTRVVCVLTNASLSTIHVEARQQLTLEECLVVGGGGAGGYNMGGGGGGGGVLYSAPRALIGAGAHFLASVGAGGLAQNGKPGSQGGHSSLAFGDDSLVAFGGNGGSAVPSSTLLSPDQLWHEEGDVGSGGGLCPNSSLNEEGKTWNPAQGHSGGPANAATGSYAGGGGGGALTASVDVDGGDGRTFDLTGEARTYGSGGGGGTHTATPGGFGGEGAGNGVDGGRKIEASAGTDGLGGGGGGGGSYTSYQSAANGGSGTVVLAFTLGDHAADSARFEVAPVADQILVGATVTPEPVVTGPSGEVLAKDRDYTLLYADNDRIGTGTVIVVGREGTPYAGLSIRMSFGIRTAYHVTGTVLDEEGDGMSWQSPMSFAAAVADAPAKSVILLKAGKYALPATVLIEKPLDIRGGFAGTDDTALADNPVTVLDAEDAPAVTNVCSILTPEKGALNKFTRIVFTGASVRGLYKSGAADLLLEDCAIVTNGTTLYTPARDLALGKALRVEHADKSTVTLRGCTVRGNRATVSDCYSGGALYLADCALVALENCDFIGNGVQLRTGGGGGVNTRNLYWFSGSAINAFVPVEATGCRFLQNFATQCNADGGCVRLNAGAQGSVFQNCVFAGNSGVNGYGSAYEMPAGAMLVALAKRTDAITVENCTFAYNANDCGQKTSAGLTIRQGTANVKNCIIFGNQLGGGASYKSSDILADANGICNLSWSLLSADDETSYGHVEGGEVNIVKGVDFGDPLFVTMLADVNARRSGGVYTVNAATIEFLNALNVHLRGGSGYKDENTNELVTNWTKRRSGNSPAIDTGDPADRRWKLEPKPNGHRVNLGAYGGTPWATMSKGGTLIFVR